MQSSTRRVTTGFIATIFPTYSGPPSPHPCLCRESRGHRASGCRLEQAIYPNSPSDEALSSAWAVKLPSLASSCLSASRQLLPLGCFLLRLCTAPTAARPHRVGTAPVQLEGLKKPQERQRHRKIN